MPFCFNCGAQINADAPFCEQCGKPNASYEPPVQQNIPAQPPVQQNIPVQQQVQQNIPVQQQVQQNIPVQQPVQPQYAPNQQPAQPQYMPQYPQYNPYMQGAAVKKSKAPLIAVIVIIAVLGIAAAIVLPIVLSGSDSGNTSGVGGNTSYNSGSYGYSNSKPYIGAWTANGVQSEDGILVFNSDGECLVECARLYFEEGQNNVLVVYTDEQHTDYIGSIKYGMSGSMLSIDMGTSNANGTNFVSNGGSGLCSPVNFSGSSRLEGVWYEYSSGDVTIITGTTMSIGGEPYSCSISGNQLTINSGDYYVCFNASISGSELTLTDTSYNDSYYFTRLY